jgi:hypothetical protein
LAELKAPVTRVSPTGAKMLIEHSIADPEDSDDITGQLAALRQHTSRDTSARSAVNGFTN